MNCPKGKRGHPGVRPDGPRNDVVIFGWSFFLFSRCRWHRRAGQCPAPTVCPNRPPPRRGGKSWPPSLRGLSALADWGSVPTIGATPPPPLRGPPPPVGEARIFRCLWHRRAGQCPAPTVCPNRVGATLAVARNAGDGIPYGFPFDPRSPYGGQTNVGNGYDRSAVPACNDHPAPAQRYTPTP